MHERYSQSINVNVVVLLVICLLRLDSRYLRLVFVAYGVLAWSSCLRLKSSLVFKVENRCGLFYLLLSRLKVGFGIFLTAPHRK